MPVPPPPGRREPAPGRPTERYATASHRCQPVLAGSSAASRSEMARSWVYACSCRRQVAASLRHVTDPAVRARQLPLPAGVGGIERGQPLGDGQLLGVRLFCRRQVAASLCHLTNERVSIPDKPGIVDGFSGLKKLVRKVAETSGACEVRTMLGHDKTSPDEWPPS